MTNEDIVKTTEDLKERLKKRFEELYTIIEAGHEAQRTINRASELCPHEVAFKGSDPHNLIAFCNICRKPLGWHCPKSPDQVCHYYSVSISHLNRTEICVELVDRSYHTLPKTHSKACESEDWCIFCGEPEERK